ncbi:UNVERIFIED_CONTAM: hypothetical protein Sindi_2860500 [Sesamum indicum]
MQHQKRNVLQELQKTAAKQGKHRLAGKKTVFVAAKNGNSHLPPGSSVWTEKMAEKCSTPAAKRRQKRQQQQQKIAAQNGCKKQQKIAQAAVETRPKQQLKLAQNDGKTHRNTSKTMASCNPCKWLQIAAEKRPKQQQKSPKTAAENAETVLTLRWGLFSRQDDFKTQNHSIEMMISRREKV